MFNESRKNEVGSNPEVIDRFTNEELIKHPVATARYIIAIIPPTIDFITNFIEYSVDKKNKKDIRYENVLSSFEKIATALDFLKEVNPVKAEKIQSHLRTTIAKVRDRNIY